MSTFLGTFRKAYLNDGSSGCSPYTLSHNIGECLQHADVSADEKTTCDGRIDVTSADVTESL